MSISRMPGHKALPPSSDLGLAGGSGRAAGTRRSWGCSAGEMGRAPRPNALLVLETCRERMEKLLSKHEAESFAVL